MEEDLMLKSELSLFCQNLRHINKHIRFEFERFAMLMVAQFIRDQRKKKQKGVSTKQQLSFQALKNSFKHFFDRCQFESYLQGDESQLREISLHWRTYVGLQDTCNFLKLKCITKKVIQDKCLLIGINKSQEGYQAKVIPEYLHRLNEQHREQPAFASTLPFEQLRFLQIYESIRNKRLNSGSNLFKQVGKMREDQFQQKESLRSLNHRLKIRSLFVYNLINRLTENHPDILLINISNKYTVSDFGTRVLIAGTQQGMISVYQSKATSTKLSSQDIISSHEQKPQLNTNPDGLKKIFQLRGHQGSVTALTLSYDQCYCLSSAMDFIIKLWCLRLGICIANYRGHSKTIWSLSFAPTGLYFLSGSGDKTARLWRTDVHHALRVYSQHTRDVTNVLFLRNTEFAITTSLDRTMMIWQLKSKNSIRNVKTCEPVSRLAIDFSGHFLVTAQESGQMVLWDLTTFNALNVFNLFSLKKKIQLDKKKIKLSINDMEFSSDGRAFVCCSKKEIALFMLTDLLQKPTKDIKDLEETMENGKRVREQNNFGHIRPRQVLDLGKQCRLVRVRFHPLNYVIALGIN